MYFLRRQRLRILANAVEKKLLGVTPVGSEMRIGEGAQSFMLDPLTVVEVEAPQHAIDPDIDGKNFRAAVGEEQDAVGDFLADAPDAGEMLAGFRGGQRGDSL